MGKRGTDRKEDFFVSEAGNISGRETAEWGIPRRRCGWRGRNFKGLLKPHREIQRADMLGQRAHGDIIHPGFGKSPQGFVGNIA